LLARRVESGEVEAEAREHAGFKCAEEKTAGVELAGVVYEAVADDDAGPAEHEGGDHSFYFY
jgi:hypothetical protein